MKNTNQLGEQNEKITDSRQRYRTDFKIPVEFCIKENGHIFLAFLFMSLIFLNCACTAWAGTPDERLFLAVLSNDITAVKHALAEGADVNSRDEKERTPLSIAIWAMDPFVKSNDFHRDIILEGDSYRSGSPKTPPRDYRIVNLLLDAGADPTRWDIPGIYIMGHALFLDTEIVEALLQKRSRNSYALGVHHFSHYGDPALRLKNLELLLEKDKDRMDSERLGGHLYIAGRFADGYFPNAESMLIKILIRGGADPNYYDYMESSEPTPLMIWLEHSPKAVRTLVKLGADINSRTRDLDGKTALMRVVGGPSRYRPGTLELLLDLGADVNIGLGEKAKMFTPIIIAALSGQDKSVSLLLKAGADINDNRTGLTPLHAATGFIATKMGVREGNFSERLASAMKTSFSQFSLAGPHPDYNFMGTVRLLVEKGANINALSDLSLMPEWDKQFITEYTEFLSDKTVGKTPLDFARMVGNKEAAEYLKSIGAKSAAELGVCVLGESPRGTSPRGAHGTGLERLRSSGSSRSISLNPAFRVNVTMST
jgi:ankyrin repeat protein